MTSHARRRVGHGESHKTIVAVLAYHLVTDCPPNMWTGLTNRFKRRRSISHFYALHSFHYVLRPASSSEHFHSIRCAPPTYYARCPCTRDGRSGLYTSTGLSKHATRVRHPTRRGFPSGRCSPGTSPSRVRHLKVRGVMRKSTNHRMSYSLSLRLRAR